MPTPDLARIHHFSPTVSDVEASADWYERVFELDHISFEVADHATLEGWVARLDELGIPHSGVRDIDEPFPFSTVVFRDPDNIQLELISMG